MMIETADFNALVDQAMREPALARLRPVIEKELLHYDLLFALDKEGLLEGLVFQGGTYLRLCHGGSRFSEDLDFAGGPDFSSRGLMEIKGCLEDYLTKRYGLEVSVKEPASLKRDVRYAELNIERWQIAITTSPQRRDLPKQKIKLEVANIPAHTQEARPLLRNYEFLPDGYEDLLIIGETRNEIMADKLFSLPATEKYVRHRDIWDLVWLTQRGAEVDTDLVKRKMTDYRLEDYPARLERMMTRLPHIIASKSFHDEMGRFLPVDVYARTLEQDKFHSYMTATLIQLLTTVKAALKTSPEKPPFQM
ncbi:nucleotidyl transferase AbiEii/AbiGii toxin family protein [Vreelandella malpeensis]|uniref:Nucleotidyl transferase AbiEii/AbiGii toxin family protein n=1 Tax=Vreelandella malpeensis TaxID=1172368 RepID=A0ABS8DPA2_9GAMM|nr:nucleotidyl transferase AbiEii/AbiGii toxin family protein [Halomonas malpeensis]MCB8888152.1 nucleotidyl transferase AbiEii/AbiGii toxin family protein [Halomonas malpeensis]